jgi:hypothetical protein
MYPTQKQRAIPELNSANRSLYDSKPLMASLAALSPTEIESMLVTIASLENQMAKLNIGGNEDEMLHLVTQGLNRLTFFLDAVKKHKDDRGDDEQSLPLPPAP